MFIKPIKTYTQRIFLPCWLILFVIIFLDITTRLTNTNVKPSSPWQAASAADNAVFTLEQAQAEQITNAINNYEVSSAPQTSENSVMSEAEQLAQQGDLSELFSGNTRYRLAGIFEKQQRFAVIEQFDVSANESKLIKVSVTDSLQGYEVANIFANKVTLNSSDNRQINLFLYKKSDRSN